MRRLHWQIPIFVFVVALSSVAAAVGQTVSTTTGAIILLLIAGRLELPGPLSRVAVVAALALLIGSLSGHPLQRILPAHPTDPQTVHDMIRSTESGPAERAIAAAS